MKETWIDHNLGILRLRYAIGANQSMLGGIERLARDKIAYGIFRNLRCDLPHRSELQHEGMPIFGWLVFQLIQLHWLLRDKS